MKDFKIRVTPEQSKIVQETCFREGGGWWVNAETIQLTDKPFLYVRDFELSWGDKEDGFINHEHPELTFDEFQLEYNGILPEKWCIRLTEDNLELVGGYYDRDFTEPIYNRKEKIGTYLTSHNLMSGVSITEKEHKCNFIIIGKPKAWVEISTEKFTKHVLKSVKTMKYQLIRPELEKAVKAILWSTDTGYDWNDNIITVPENIKKLKDAGVLHWFEEVKEEFKVESLVSFFSETNNCTITSKIKTWGSSSYCVLENGLEPFKHLLRTPTESEIKEYELLEEAKRRYPIGTKYYDVCDSSGKRTAKVQGEFKWYSALEHITDSYGGHVYFNGKWAEILPNEPDIIINAYRAEFRDGYVKFGCVKINKELFLRIFDITSNKFWKYEGNKSVEAVTIGKGKFTVDQIKQIAEYYINK